MSHSNRVPLPDPDASPTEQQPDDRPPRRVLARRLTDAERTVYESIDLEGLTPSELADFEPWEPSTIRTLLARARRKLEEEPNPDEPPVLEQVRRHRQQLDHDS